MKKNLLALGILIAGLTATAQTPRLSLYEEFTGETCPPCASTNPGLNVKLKANASKIVAIKWQVPIPSAPSNTWSLYQTNKAEIDWRYRSLANGGYGYTPGISSAPSSKIDGREATVFGASSGHPANLNNNVINSAQSNTAAFSISANREWDATCSSINVTVNIQATAGFTATGNLVFRLVMVEEHIEFATQPGTNGEKIFEDAAIASFPTLQAGTPMASTWVNGQTQTFTLNCPLPSYVRKKEEVAFVGFIQDDGNQRVAQAVRVSKSLLTNDAVAIDAKVAPACSSTIAPVVTVKNNGLNAITALTITPYADALVGNTTAWTGNLAPGATTTISLNSITTSTTIGAHTFSFNISALSSADNNTNNNKAKVSYVVANSYTGTPVAEGFVAGAFPPVKFTSVNSDGAIGWSRVTSTGGYQASNNAAKYDFFNNTNIGDVDELYLPPIDLNGTSDPDFSFDWSYAQRTSTSDDKLEVFISSDCGANWTSIFSASGAALMTSAEVASAYLPSDVGEWMSETKVLPGFNKSNILVKFVVTNDNGNNLYIDNINLSQSKPVGINKVTADGVSFNVYPNPSNGLTTVGVNSPMAAKAKVSVLNTIGQVVYEQNAELTVGGNLLQMDVKNLPSGIYTISIESNKNISVKKLVVTH